MTADESLVAEVMNKLMDNCDLNDLAYLIRTDHCQRRTELELSVSSGEELVQEAKRQHGERSWAAALAAGLCATDMRLVLSLTGLHRQQHQQLQLHPLRVLLYRAASEFADSEAASLAQKLQLPQQRAAAAGSEQFTDCLCVLHAAACRGLISEGNLAPLRALCEPVSQLCDEFERQRSAAAAAQSNQHSVTDCGDGSAEGIGLRNKMSNRSGRVDKDGYYVINNRLCVILNVNKCEGSDERKGSEKDMSDLYNVLDGPYDIKEISDPTKDEFCSRIVEIKGIIREYDMLLFIAMAHGQKIEQKQQIMLRDGPIELEGVVISPFQDGCLKSKPKIFMFQCCRGESLSKLEFDQIPPANICSKDNNDLFVMYGSFDGYRAMRKPQEGSLFVQVLCKKLRDSKGKNVKLSDLKTMVTREVSQREEEYEESGKKIIVTQTSCVDKDTLTADLCLLP